MGGLTGSCIHDMEDKHLWFEFISLSLIQANETHYMSVAKGGLSQSIPQSTFGEWDEWLEFPIRIC